MFEDIKFDDIMILKDDFKQGKGKQPTHDELIEEYERKINKTKQLL